MEKELLIKIAKLEQIIAGQNLELQQLRKSNKPTVTVKLDGGSLD